jgi:hypothetical protein
MKFTRQRAILVKYGPNEEMKEGAKGNGEVEERARREGRK